MNKHLADKKRSQLLAHTMAGENQESKKSKKELITIPLSSIREDKNIRSSYNDKSIQELSESIKANGLLQPITVSEQEDGYVILYGHRRFLAAQAAGWTEIECIVLTEHFSNEVERIITQTIENEDREEVPAADKEAAVLKLETEYNLTANEICTRFGKSRGWYSQIKGAHEFREQHGKLFEEAGVPLYTKEAYKMRDYSEEQVKQVIESLKSGDAKAGVLSETADSTKKETRGRKSKQKAETQDMGFDIDEAVEICPRIMINKDRTFTVEIPASGKAESEQFIASLESIVCQHLVKQGFTKA